MLFAISQRDAPRSGRLVYDAKDWAIDFETEVEQGSRDCTVLVRDLNIEFDLNTREALTIWGYHPHTGWKLVTLNTPLSIPGNLLLLDERIGLLEIVRLPESEAWQSQYDVKTRWLCVGDPQFEEEDQAVEFSTNVIAVIKRTDLKAIWLKPVLIR